MRSAPGAQGAPVRPRWSSPIAPHKARMTNTTSPSRRRWCAGSFARRRSTSPTETSSKRIFMLCGLPNSARELAPDIPHVLDLSDPGLPVQKDIAEAFADPQLTGVLSGIDVPHPRQH